MQKDHFLQKLLLRMLTGLVLAALFLALSEVFGFGSSRKTRMIVFVARVEGAEQLGVSYVQEGSMLRRREAPLSGGRLLDQTELPAGTYLLEIDVSGGKIATFSTEKEVVLGEEEQLEVQIP